MQLDDYLIDIQNAKTEKDLFEILEDYYSGDEAEAEALLQAAKNNTLNI
jgi:hypothetical protein